MIDPPMPPHVVLALQSSYEAYRAVRHDGPAAAHRVERATRFADVAAAVREAGWPVQTVAAVCGLTTRRLRTLVNTYASGVDPGVVIPAGPHRTTHLSTVDARRIRDLYPHVADVRGDRARDEEDRVRARTFIQLLRQHRDRGVSWAELSAATTRWRRWPLVGDRPAGGGTECALRARVARADQRDSERVTRSA